MSTEIFLVNKTSAVVKNNQLLINSNESHIYSWNTEHTLHFLTENISTLNKDLTHYDIDHYSSWDREFDV